MKTQIIDKRALSSISIASLRFYLKSRDWTDDGLWGGGRASLYLKESEGKSWDILVPTRDSAGDYAAVMAETLAVLADAEDRPQLDIFQDIMGADADSCGGARSTGWRTSRSRRAKEPTCSAAPATC